MYSRFRDTQLLGSLSNTTFIVQHVVAHTLTVLYKITQIRIKLLKFYIKFGYFVSCFSEVCES